MKRPILAIGLFLSVLTKKALQDKTAGLQEGLIHNKEICPLYFFCCSLLVLILYRFDSIVKLILQFQVKFD